MGLKPGPPAAGEPVSFAFLNDSRLLNNANITTMPTTQAAWNTFIMELNKWVKNSTNGFEPTLTGFSSAPSNPFIWYQRYGQLVFMELYIGTGTSNTNNFAVTNLPSEITPKNDVNAMYHHAVNDSIVELGPHLVYINSDGTMDFTRSLGNSAWTSSGTKGLDAVEKSSFVYMLRNPEKL